MLRLLEWKRVCETHTFYLKDFPKFHTETCLNWNICDLCLVILVLMWLVMLYFCYSCKKIVSAMLKSLEDVASPVNLMFNSRNISLKLNVLAHNNNFLICLAFFSNIYFNIINKKSSVEKADFGLKLLLFCQLFSICVELPCLSVYLLKLHCVRFDCFSGFTTI